MATYDPSKDPTGFDPSNPNTAIINGQLYVWQPSTAGQDAQAYLGANADPALVNQDTSPASGNGSWVPASYEHPGGEFGKMLGLLLAAGAGGGLASEFLVPGSVAGAGAASAGAASAAPAATTTALGSSLPVTAYTGGAGTTIPLTAAGTGSTLAPIVKDGIKNGSDNKDLLDRGAKTAAAVPSWLKGSIALAAPTLGKLFGGGSSDLTNSLTQALTGLVPDLKQSFDLGIQRQQQASPLYDAVLKMALGRLPNWSTGGDE